MINFNKHCYVYLHNYLWVIKTSCLLLQSQYHVARNTKWGNDATLKCRVAYSCRVTTCFFNVTYLKPCSGPINFSLWRLRKLFVLSQYRSLLSPTHFRSFQKNAIQVPARYNLGPEGNFLFSTFPSQGCYSKWTTHLYTMIAIRNKMDCSGSPWTHRRWHKNMHFGTLI